MKQNRDQSILIQRLLFESFNLIKKNADGIFRKHGLTGAQVGVLSCLDKIEGKAMNKISERLWCDVSNITGVVDRLEKQGLVRRKPDPNDRRVSLVCITQKGKEALSAVLPEHEETIIKRFAGLSEEERETLVKLLLKVTG